MYFMITILTLMVGLGYGLIQKKFMGYLDDKSGEITSPGYPGDYPNNVNYTWMIRTGHSKSKVTITVINMDIERCDDYLEIQEVDPCCYTSYKKCGIIQREQINARGNTIKISFVADRRGTGKGFRLSWTVSSPLPPTISKTIILSTSKPLTPSWTRKTTTPTRTRRTPPTTTRKTTPTTTTNHAVPIKPKISVSRTSSQVTTVINATINPLLVTKMLTHTIINSSTAVSINVISSEFTVGQIVSLIIGICVVELILVTAAICVRKRLQASSSDKTSPPPDIDQNASNHYHSIPLENFSTSEFKVAEEGVYVDGPDNLYDSTFASRPHTNQDNFNVYQTCEKTYDTTFSRR